MVDAVRRTVNLRDGAIAAVKQLRYGSSLRRLRHQLRLDRLERAPMKPSAWWRYRNIKTKTGFSFSLL